jgi:flagellar biosynthetic protein FliR
LGEGVAELPFHASVFLILFARIGAVLMLLPAFSDEGIPVQIKLLLGIGATVGLYGILGHRIAAAATDEAALGGIVVAEMAVGLAIGAVIRIMFSAATMAGSFASQQVGLTSALLPDPAMGGQVPILAKVISLAATVLCLGLGVHHLWIWGIVKSYTAFPVGHLPPASDFARLAVTCVTQAMSLGLSMAAPLMLYGILFHVALGFAARMAPTIQVFFITQPLNILCGFALFTVTLGVALNGFAQAMALFMQSGWAG